jgi:hypothetical protein
MAAGIANEKKSEAVAVGGYNATDGDGGGFLGKDD